jgi:hypothetical protein
MNINNNVLSSSFWEAHELTLFDQKTVANVLGISPAKLERDRWIGGGIPYLKIGRAIRYSKRDVVDWLAKRSIKANSTAEYTGDMKGGRNDDHK